MTPRTVTTWNAFRDAWAGVHNFMMAGECVPFAFAFPPIEQVAEELRSDEQVNIRPGTKGSRLLTDDVAASFRAKPIEQALREPFSMAHFRLSVFDQPGRFLHDFGEKVLEPWQAALRDAGFTWDRCYPIIFMSGPGSATNYHMDFSHVVAWQVHGHKRFCGLKDPDRWAPREVRVNYKAGELERPAQLPDDDALCYDMPPGAVLWNALLTPHWVEASGAAAMSLNISHGGLRLHGELCPHEQQLEEHRAANPDAAPQKLAGRY